MVEWRHERKIPINPADHAVLSSILRASLKVDPNSGPHGSYLVRSLYFDDAFDQALTDKLDGVFCRKKFRIRTYNNETNYISLEKKVKRGELGLKQKAVLTKEECQSILAGDFGFLKNRNEEVCQELYVNLSTNLFWPQSIVQYEREAYVFEPGHIRITIDSQIRFTTQVSDFLSPTASLVATGDHSRVLEVKYGTFLPLHLSKLLQIENRSVSTMSKYAISRRFN